MDKKELRVSDGMMGEGIFVEEGDRKKIFRRDEEVE